MIKMVYVLVADNVKDIYGYSLYNGKQVFGIFDTDDRAQAEMRNVYNNPHFSGNLWIVPFIFNKNISGYVESDDGHRGN